ncbi:hypothetical protein SEVIR_2G296201v4 [Setaria viridis]
MRSRPNRGGDQSPATTPVRSPTGAVDEGGDRPIRTPDRWWCGGWPLPPFPPRLGVIPTSPCGSKVPRPRDGSARIHGGLIPSPCVTAPLASCKPHRGRRRVDCGRAAMVDGIWDADLGRSCTARRWLPPST